MRKIQGKYLQTGVRDTWQNTVDITTTVCFICWTVLLR